MSDERRVVTVLFADVTGSTALGEMLDPEDLRALLSRYYAIAKDVVAAHGGTVEKFIGDAVMAVFGLRRAHGDDAVRALSAALELRDRVQSEPRLADRMPIRLGVNTGDVIASRDPAGDDFLVTGDAVNVAARIQQSAMPWSIVAGERTVRAARSEFRFAPPQPIEAKGKSEPLMVSELLGRANAMAGRTPIFGRDADLAQIDLVARRAFDEQRPFLVSVIAPAGTGKSRLLEEFIDRLRATAPDARVAVAQCLPYGQRLTYWPLRAVLFRIVGLDEDAMPSEVRTVVDRWLTEAEVEDAAEVGRLLVSTIGEGDAEVNDRAALFGAWRSFVEAASRQAPLVVAVEDLHWSSDTLLDLFEFVLQPRGDTRALLIALARPELLDRRPNWGAGRRNHVSIALEPLDDGATAQLVRTLAEGASDDLVEAIVTRAEGNPFFAGEIVSAVLERVRSFVDAEQVKAALARLPDTVQATVLARLDELPDDEREVLRVGSVFGRSFRPQGVAALIGRDELTAESVANTSERLTERDLIRPSGSDGYTFRHILIREVAYSTLPRSTRAQLHGAAGRWLEERASGREESVAELIAYHYREAAALATAMDLDGASELRDSARIWLTMAAQVASAAAATVEARAHALGALQFARDTDLPELYELLGDNEIGGSPIIAAYAQAREHAKRLNRSPEIQLRLLAKQMLVETRSQGSVATRMSDAEFNQLRAEGEALLRIATDPEARARFLVAESFYPFWLRTNAEGRAEGVVEAARQSGQEALDIAERLDNPNLESAALDALGSLAQERYDWVGSLALAKRRIQMSQRLVLFEQIDAYAVAAWSALLAGELDVADELSAAGLVRIQPGQAPDWTLHLVAWRVTILMLIGKWTEALQAAERADRLWLESGRPAAGYSGRGFCAGIIVARARGDEMLAARLLASIEEIQGKFRENQRAALMLAISRNALDTAATELWDEFGLSKRFAPEYGTMALSLLNDAQRGLPPERLAQALEQEAVLSVPILRAELLRALGLVSSDAASLRAALQLFISTGARPYAARVQCELGLLEGDRSEFDRGLIFLESIGDVVQVERYLKRWSGRGS
jgi:class 3 adenylate cyclase